MEEKLCQISEEEACSNYNYEEFVRTISKEDKFPTKANKTEKLENKYYQKEFLINNIQSSDVTSISLSQTENTSQTSENIFSNTNGISENPKETKFNENELNYYFGVENYFRKIYPEKFDEYKNSRNFLPKNRKDINVNKFQNNLLQTPIEENQMNNNNINNFQYGNNFYYYPVNGINGNIIYCIYNNFYFNFLNTQSQPTNKNDKNQPNNNTEKNFNQKEEDKKEKEKENFNETKDKENLKQEKIEDEYESVYIIKRKNNKSNSNSNRKNNKMNFCKNFKQERPKEKRCKDKDYNYHNYNNRNNYYYNNDNFNKFNGNYDKRRKKFYGENNYYKNKYHKETYY